MLFSSRHSPGETARVVVTGAGILTPLGTGWETNSRGFRAGRTVFGPVTLFDVSRQRTRMAAQASVCQAPPDCVEVRTGRASSMLRVAAGEALRQAGWEKDAYAPIVLATTSGEMPSGEAYLRQSQTQPEVHLRQAARVIHYQPQRQALDLCTALHIHGPITIISNACASGTNAIGHAFELVRSGGAQRALTGGYDPLCELTFSGFNSLQAMSASSCRPFAADRDGLLLGEGAAVLTLESLVHARARDAVVLGEILGYGACVDLHHLTQPDPTGAPAVRAMRSACAQAGIAPDQVDYVNAHGTATIQNDAAEALAINQWAGSAVRDIAVSSTKASIGHLLGAAGAVEAVVCLMALQEQWLPPELGVERVDPICGFELVKSPRDAAVNIAMSNSFGFGGANATLVIRRWV